MNAIKYCRSEFQFSKKRFTQKELQLNHDGMIFICASLIQKFTIGDLLMLTLFTLNLSCIH